MIGFAWILWAVLGCAYLAQREHPLARYLAMLLAAGFGALAVLTVTTLAGGP